MENTREQEKILQALSPDGGFLQSREWLEFQQYVGRPVFLHADGGFVANCITHTLPVVGTYWYVPRGPVMTHYEKHNQQLYQLAQKAKEQGMAWVRVEPVDEQSLRELQNAFGKKLVKAPYDVQPKEIFTIDITAEEKDILAAMKPKTRYNIGLAEKKGVIVSSCHVTDNVCALRTQDFLRLTDEMARRQGIATHPAQYYEKMIAKLGDHMLRLYIAEYDGKVIAANLVLVFGTHATYLHGASSNDYRNVMAPYLLQWHAIKDAKAARCEKYDFGGVKTTAGKNNWSGITGFKLGFSTKAQPVTYPGTFDIVVNPHRYAMYRGLQKAKMFIKKVSH